VLLDDGAPARLGARAVDLLVALVQRRPRVVSKHELFELVWPDLVVEENNLQQHISALRKLLGAQAITTVPGRGYQFVLQVDDAPEPEAAGALAAAPADAPRRSNLPALLPQLFGREADLAELRSRLAVHGVVTLVGPGGIGKTRLAQAAAAACQGDFIDGVWAVDCAALTDGALLADAVARELAVVLTPTADPGAARQTLASALRDQALLLLLDNCEHVLGDAAALVDALRQRARRVRVLATSQQPLQLADEQVIRLTPLALPPPAATAASAPELASYGAVQLFLARAQAADRHFEATPDSLEAVVDICRRLDGLPLAIELAAARVPLLGVHTLRRRLDEGLRVLAAASPRLPARQQTLRAALAWSHGLLGADEQALFRRLGVFAGGFSIELAEQVYTDDGTEPWGVLDLLGALVDKSLVMVDTGAEPRYRLLESARSFALEALDAAGEAARWRERHARALAQLLQVFDQAVSLAPRFEPLVGRMALELDNLLAAMQWLQAAAAPTTASGLRQIGIALAAHSDWLWGEVDRAGEGYRYCQLARSWLDETVPLALASRLRLTWQAHARSRRLAPALWLDDLHLALDGFRTCGDRVGQYRALCALAVATRAGIGDAEAMALLREAEQLEDAAWSPRLRLSRQVALELRHDLGGRLELAVEAGRRHLVLARAAGGLREIGALGNLADTEFALGHVDEAIALCRQAIERAGALGRAGSATHAYQNMVPALLARGRLDEALEAIRAGQGLMWRRLGTAYDMLLQLALLVHRRGDARLAAQLLGCADRAYAERGQQPDLPERRVRDTLLAELPVVLEGAAFEVLLHEGAAWSEDEAWARGGLA
jgi:predicted ATPase/DNA-binding winged helix-turn-helix (wHTH) protein